MDFRLTYNSGAAWGMLQGARVYFLVIAAITVVAVLAYLLTQKQHPMLVVLGFGFFIGGSIGNAIDRAMTGRVVDFLNFLFIDFPIFNIADCGITVGAALVILFLILSSFTESVEKTDDAPVPQEASPVSDPDMRTRPVIARPSTTRPIARAATTRPSAAARPGTAARPAAAATTRPAAAAPRPAATTRPGTGRLTVARSTSPSGSLSIPIPTDRETGDGDQ
jgi:signal peptidase II